ncbi:MAG: DedA family protein [Mollicutes bacterium]|nr:DedA family protein [Mollicutes bacterium]
MQEFIINIMNIYGYIGVFLLILLENIFPPIPSELILLFGGFMTTYTKLNIIGMIISSTLGSLIGALLLYKIGTIFSKEKLKILISGKLGRVLKLKNSDIDNANKWFTNEGKKTVFFGRFIPLIRSIISIPAGINKMNISKFITYTLLGSVIWNLVLIILGHIVGKNWKAILKIFKLYSRFSLLLLFILLIILITKLYKNKSKEKNIY